jgi:hypothetical protein
MSRVPQLAGRGRATTSGANFVGEELYNRLRDFLIKHMKELAKVFIWFGL